jgi:hypothetical protein
VVLALPDGQIFMLCRISLPLVALRWVEWLTAAGVGLGAGLRLAGQTWSDQNLYLKRLWVNQMGPAARPLVPGVSIERLNSFQRRS